MAKIEPLMLDGQKCVAPRTSASWPERERRGIVGFQTAPRRGREASSTMEMWHYRGQVRPKFALQPGPGQDSVWDYPRPPRIAPDDRRVVVRRGEHVLADSTGAVRVLETASPPTFYLPPGDVSTDLLIPAAGSSSCEWKGAARYWSLAIPGADTAAVAWCYDTPTAGFWSLAGYYAFYPALVECLVADERVRPQPGEFYGGWVTQDVVGPFKGEPGTGHW